MPRATIIVVVDEPAEVQAVEDWFIRWSSDLTHRSMNHGCGCCVDIWEIEASDEAIAALPPNTLAGDRWQNGG